MAAVLVVIGASVVVPAGWSVYTLSNVTAAVKDVESQNARLTAIRALLDELGEIDHSYSALLNGVPIGQQQMLRTDRLIQSLTALDSRLYVVMAGASELVPADEQSRLWTAAQGIVRSWNAYTTADTAESRTAGTEAQLRDLSNWMNDIAGVVRSINDKLTVGNDRHTRGALDRLRDASILLMTILFGAIVITASASLLVVIILRVTRRAEQAIRSREAALSQQNLQFKAALDNMRHGLTMFDADGALEIYNDRVLSMYGLPAQSVRPGMTVEDITAVRNQHGYPVTSESGKELDTLFDVQKSAAREPGETSLWDEDERNLLVNGRTVRITRSPRADGGYVVMHADITERQQALINLEARENELTEQIQRFKDLVDGVPFGLSMYDSNQRLIIGNRPYVSIYGLSDINPGPGTTYNQIVDSIFANGTFADSSRPAREAFRRSALSTIASSRVIPFGDGRSVLMSRYPRRGGGWVEFHEDVTVRVKVERELETSRTELATEIERFKDALDNMGQGLSMYDADERLVVFNRHFLEINKLSEKDITPNIKLSDVVALLLANRVYDFKASERLKDYVETVTSSEGFVDVRHQVDGRVIQISSYARPAGGFVVIHNDITERENARRELELSEAAQRLQSELFKDALDNIGYGLNVFDAKARILVYNKQYLEMTGLTEADIPIGSSVRHIIDTRAAKGLFPESSEEFYAAHREQIYGKHYFEHIQTSCLGQVISSSFYPRAAGGWVVLHSDITERIRAEESKRRAAEEAEELRRQRHAALAANQAKSAFLAMMSHEIRTPMNAVIGLSAALLDSDLAGDQLRLVDTIHESSNSLLRLLNDILDMSKLDAGKVEFEAAPFSPAALLDNAVSIVAARAAEKGLKIRARAKNRLPPALIGDHARLRQVILNLATNAIKFTEGGSVEISARFVSETDERAELEFGVSDTGIGIAPDQIEKLFQEFSQADASINRKFGGTGLGLAISKRIVEQMGGEISVESVLGQGTAFTFRLALPKTSEIALGENRGHAADDVLNEILVSLNRPLRVLLAEDNATNQLVFTKLAQPFNFDVTVAGNGREAVEHARQTAFDVVFMDMRMPEMDGLAASRAIRALGGDWQGIPIIALTANAFPDDMKACREAGMSEFMAKPIRKKNLIEKLSKLLGDRFPTSGEPHPATRKSVEARPELPRTPPAEVALADVAPIIDQTAFDELVEAIGADGVRATLDVFVTDTAARLDLMRTFSCVNDRTRIKDEAHTLKGASGTFGMRQVFELARQLEFSAQAVGAVEYGEIVARLDACFRLARDEAERACAEARA
jgi:signal transduction histidine kinase/DNA-binding NarL/FixJ family response regulator/HPt (histidine-containing phosphotransfer) domain-containing protein